MFVMLRTLCTCEGASLIDNRDVSGIGLYKYELHLLDNGKKI